MNWTLVGSIIVGIITLIGGIAGVVQIVQYIEQRQAAALQVVQGRLSDAQIPRGSPKERSIPNNLPPRVFFIGREDKKRELYGLLQSKTQVIIVEGVAGIGKTSLALEVAYRYLGEAVAVRRKERAKFIPFNAFIWITAKAGVVTINSVLDITSRALDYPYIAQLQAEDKFNAGIVLMRKKKTLLIIDNFETIDDEKVIQLVEKCLSQVKC